MGVSFSNPVDAGTKQEIQDLIKAVLGTFTVQYTKAYTIAMIKQAMDDAKDDAMTPTEEDYELQQRPEWKENLKSGYLLKEGGIRKSWKRRYFVVRPSYNVDYYVNEEESKKEKGKKKGTMGLCNYYVVTDVNDGILKRLKDLAEKMGMNFDDLPKPKEYPPLTFELHHYRRRCFFLQAEKEEDFKDWVAQFRTACWRAHSLTIDEPCHQIAFPEAIRLTRIKLGRWGWYTWGGTEVQILSDLISDELDYVVMGKIYGKIQGPWIVRQKIRQQVLKGIDSIVTAAVTPGWAAMEKAVEVLRPKIEPKLKELVGPIGKAQGELLEKIKQGVMSIVNPLLDEHVKPHLSKIMEVIKSPMTEAYEESYKIFDTEVSKFEIKDAPKQDFHNLDWVPRGWWSMRPALEKTDVMYDPLWALNVVFPDIYPWGLIWTAHDELRNRMDDAVYTFEQKVLAAVEAGEHKSDPKALVEKLKQEVLIDFKHDGKESTLRYYCAILKKIVYPPFEKLVIPAVESVLQPINDAIPEPLKDFIDINDLFEELVNDIIDEIIRSLVRADEPPPKRKPKAKKEKKAIEEGKAEEGKAEEGKKEEAPKSEVTVEG
jgi:hypothetical protein